MSRSLLHRAALVLAAVIVAACGKYGPPHRAGGPTPAATLPGSPIPPPPLPPEGTGILNPSSVPLPVPSAPPEEPEEDPAP